MTGTIGNDTPIQESSDFKLWLKNPCLDSDYVTIQTKPLVVKAYDLYYSQIAWTHDAFVINTVPTTHTLCGDLTYKATFMDSLIDPSTTPMSYNSASRTYTFYTED